MTALALVPITALLSALQGFNAVSKGYLIAAHVFSCTILGYLAGLSWIPLAGVSVAVPGLFWVALRGGAQAEEELDYMARKPWASLGRVAIVHAPHLIFTLAFIGYGVWRGQWYLLAWAVAALVSAALPLLALRVWNYDTKPGLINTGKFWDVRRPTEIATGLAGGVAGAAIMATALSLWG